MTPDEDPTSAGNAAAHRPPIHIGYAVKDIPEAASFWAQTFGVGPFLLLDHIVFDELEHGDEPVVFDHSAAFAQWGPIAVELQQIHTLEPEATLAPMLRDPTGRPNHVSYLAEDPEQESARLAALGAPKLLWARTGPVEVTFHDVPWLGHAIEIHQDSEFIRGFHAEIAQAAEGWDGVDPLRVRPF